MLNPIKTVFQYRTCCLFFCNNVSSPSVTVLSVLSHLAISLCLDFHLTFLFDWNPHETGWPQSGQIDQTWPLFLRLAKLCLHRWEWFKDIYRYPSLADDLFYTSCAGFKANMDIWVYTIPTHETTKNIEWYTTHWTMCSSSGQLYNNVFFSNVGNNYVSYPLIVCQEWI